MEREGKKLSITPYLRDHGVVELRVFEAVQREGRETIAVVDTLLVLDLLLEPRQTKLLFDDVQKLEVTSLMNGCARAAYSCKVFIMGSVNVNSKSPKRISIFSPFAIC